MHPKLFTFPDWLPFLSGKSVHVYGLMIALAFLFGLWWIKRESKRVGLDQKRVVDLFFYTVIAGLIGSRILYIFYFVPGFWRDPLVFFKVWEGGLVFQGGVMGALLVVIWLCRRYQLAFFKVADVFSPALSMGHAIGRIGCFFAGCCYGKQCSPDFPLVVVFPRIEGGIAPPGVPLYPTQLFESFGEIIIFAILVTYRKKKPYEGAVFLLYLVLYSILRFFIEFLRGDFHGPRAILTNAQIISVGMVAGAFLMWLVLRKRSAKQKGSNAIYRV